MGRKREEEKTKAAEDYSNNKYSDGINSLICAEDFLAGVEWSDHHPKEGLLDADNVIEIAHEVINSDTIVQYLIFDDENIYFDSELFLEDLRNKINE